MFRLSHNLILNLLVLSDYTCLFAHYNSNGTVNGSVYRLLRALGQLPCHLVFITNSSLGEVDREQVNRCAESVTIVVRENLGNDFGAWQEVLVKHSIDIKTRYLILANDSVFGPLYDFRQLFLEMAQKHPDADYWGITDSFEGEWHIQSYFIVLSSAVFLSEAFQDFWKIEFNQLPKIEIIKRGEIGLSSALKKAGFKGAVLAPSVAVDAASANPAFAMNNTHFFWQQLVSDFQSPFIKKELLLKNPNNLKSVKTIFAFVAKVSDYPVELFEEYLAEAIQSGNGYNGSSAIAVVCHLFYPHTVYAFLHRLSSLQSTNSKFIFNLSKELMSDQRFRTILGKAFPLAIVLHSPAQGRDVGGKLAGVELMLRLGIQSEYTLVIHDKVSPHTSLGTQWRDNLLQIIDAKKIEEVTDLFSSDKKAGVIGTKAMIRNEFNPDKHNFRTTSSDNIFRYISSLNLRIDDYNFIAGTIFWIRTSILEKFFAANSALEIRSTLEKGNALDFSKGTNIHAWERLFCFIANAEGYKIRGV